MSPDPRCLSAAEGLDLARSLGDRPGTVIAVHQLRQGVARAWASAPDAPNGVVQAAGLPREPAGFGTSAVQLADTLTRMSGWDCVNVDPAVATELARELSMRTGEPARLYVAPSYELLRPVARLRHPWVRRMGTADAALITSAPIRLQPAGWGSVETQIREGGVAAAAWLGRIVATASVYARSATYADIGVSTAPEFRGRGLATAAASLVAESVQRAGRVPVWSTGALNWPSRQIATRLGFTESRASVYVVLDGLKGTGFRPSGSD